VKSTSSYTDIFAKPTMTVPELSTVLGIGLRQTYAGIRSGEFPSIRIGNRILISTRVVNQILDAGTVPDPAA
jgi:excisionase family DNA binding protein